MGRSALCVVLCLFGDRPDLRPQGAEVSQPSAPSCSVAWPPYPGLPAEQPESQRTLPGLVASVSVEIQTVPTALGTI